MTKKYPLKKDPDASEVASWLKGIKPEFTSDFTGAATYVAEQLMEKVFKGEYKDALKPYATLKQKGEIPKDQTRGARYPQLIMTEKKGDNPYTIVNEWKDAEDFTDSKEKTYLPILVHLAGVMKHPDLPEELSFAHKYALAKALSRKAVSVEAVDAEGKVKPKEEGKKYLDDYAKEISKLSEDKVKEAVDKFITEQSEKRGKASAASRKAKKTTKKGEAAIAVGSIMDLEQIKNMVNGLSAARKELTEMKKSFGAFIKKTEKALGDLEKEAQLFETLVERASK